MRTVLIFGDSNVWGYIGGSGARYPAGIRWPTVAAGLLGEKYRIIEDGVCGRTTVYPDPFEEGRCGADALNSSLLAAAPLDLLVLMLGTNDLKFADASHSALGLDRLVEMAQNCNARGGGKFPVFPNGAKILVLSPIHIGQSVAEYEESPYIRQFGIQESLKFSDYYKKVAERRGAYFLDAAQYAEPCREDGEHMTAQGHRALGKAVAEHIQEIFSDPNPCMIPV